MVQLAAIKTLATLFSSSVYSDLLLDSAGGKNSPLYKDEVLYEYGSRFFLLHEII